MLFPCSIARFILRRLYALGSLLFLQTRLLCAVRFRCASNLSTPEIFNLRRNLGIDFGRI